MTGAGFVLYKTNFLRQVWENPNTNAFFLDVSLTCIGLNITLMLYLTLYLPYIAKVTEDWETYCPQIIPVMTLSGVIAFISGIVGLWPIWGFLTIVYVIILIMGYTMTLIFLPDGFFGALIFWLFTIGLAFTSHYLPHDPDW
mmetsp:Transcript_8378/g.7743  ORF Transcript_8378/g.7743 Transcript_8378/m.7743 type:complete len:142 (+) Transcript_8378:296-721(+)